MRRLLWFFNILLLSTIVFGVSSAQDSKEGDSAAGPEASAGPRQFDTLPVKENLQKFTSEMARARRDGAFTSDTQRALFDDFYKSYILPRWSYRQNLAVQRGQPGLRKELQGHLSSAKGAVHDHLNLLVFNFMKGLVKGNYDPAVQANAILTIGELNSVEATPTVDAKPFSEALPVLIDTLENSDACEGVRAAALVGIVRHTAAGISNNDQLKLLNQAVIKEAEADIPTGVAGLGRDWMRGQAIEALGNLKSVGAANQVFGILVKTVGDSDLSAETRCIAARALGRLNYSGAKGIDVVQTGVVLADFVLDVCNDKSAVVRAAGRSSLQRLRAECAVAAMIGLNSKNDNQKGGILALAGDEPATRLAELKEHLKALLDAFEDRPNQSRESAEAEKAAKDALDAIAAWVKAQSK